METNRKCNCELTLKLRTILLQTTLAPGTLVGISSMATDGAIDSRPWPQATSSVVLRAEGSPIMGALAVIGVMVGVAEVTGCICMILAIACVLDKEVGVEGLLNDWVNIGRLGK